ncbi:hypothetical protein HGM15179_021529, partial [Zosterops borbonicus]
MFQMMRKSECYFINSTEKVRYVERFIYNREQLVHFDSDVGHYVGDTPDGEKQARYANSQREDVEHKRSQVDNYCRRNYEVRWFEGQQELSGQVVATDVVPNGDWSHQLLVLLERPPRRGLSYTCQVEHVSLEQPLRRHWGTGEPLGGLAEAVACAGSEWELCGERAKARAVAAVKAVVTISQSGVAMGRGQQVKAAWTLVVRLACVCYRASTFLCTLQQQLEDIKLALKEKEASADVRKDLVAVVVK